MRMMRAVSFSSFAGCSRSTAHFLLGLLDGGLRDGR
jgi:hypothetical protein